jgi:hypothetical protein
VRRGTPLDKEDRHDPQDRHPAVELLACLAVGLAAVPFMV